MSEMLANDYAAHPLIDGMRRAGAIDPYFDLPIRDSRQDGWISGEDLFLGNDQRCGRLRLYHCLLDSPGLAGYWAMDSGAAGPRCIS